MKATFLIFTLGCLRLWGDVIGVETFDYPDGSIGGLAGGSGWNYDQSTEFDDNGVEPGADSDASNWDILSGAPVVLDGMLVTNSSWAKREYNGPSSGASPNSEEKDGAFRGTGVIYYRVDLTRFPGSSWCGISGYDFGGERMYFGITSANAATGLISIEQTAVAGTNGTKTLEIGRTYALVAKIDLDANLLSMWIDPDFSLPESGNTPDVTRVYTATNWNTALRLASDGEVVWDNLAVATKWLDLDIIDNDMDGMPYGYEVRYGLNPALNDASLDLDDDTLSNFTEFQNGTFPNDKDTDDDFLEDQVENGGGVWISVSLTGTDPLDPDSDNDGLLDGYENNLGFFDNAESTGTNPNIADTDGDGALDGTEVLCGSDPIDEFSTPDPGDANFVGADFVYYLNGPIAGRSGGAGFDYDNDLAGNAFIGHTCLHAIWSGSASVIGGAIQTNNSRAFRSLTGSAPGDGNFSTDETASQSQTLYVKFEMTRRTGASWGGLSTYDGTGNELFFFGVSTTSGDPRFAIVDQEIAPGTNYLETVPSPVNTDEKYTMVAKIEHDPAAQANGIELSFFVNPDLSLGEPAPTIVQLVTPLGPINSNTIRLASGPGGISEWEGLVLGTSWETLRTVADDLDNDGMPDEWERYHDLIVGINDGLGNADGDDFTNLDEFLNRTNARLTDTDGDTLSDSDEVNLYGSNPNLADSDGDGIRDDEEVREGEDGVVTNPSLADSDNDGGSDPDEIENGSDPNDPGDLFGGDRALVGCDDFSTYDGAILNGQGGIGFDFDSSPENDSFVGHTGSSSAWNDEGAGGAMVVNGVLVTRNNGASREFNGPGEGAAAGQDERYGAVNQDWFSNAIYLKVEMTRRAGATVSRFGSDDFGNFRHAFGVFDVGEGPKWGISIDGGAAQTATSSIADDTTYTLVAKVDYPRDQLVLWINPDLTDLEGNNEPMIIATYTKTEWASAVQLGSEGTGDTEWGDLVVAREWNALDKSLTPGPVERRVVITASSFNMDTSQAILTWISVPEATYRIEHSIDLRNWNNERTGIASGGTSTTLPITILSGPPVKLFYRVVEE